VPLKELAQGGWQCPPIRAIIDTSSGGEASRLKNFTLNPLLFLIMFKFQSSAIENISDVEDGKVIITFTGGRDYTYAVPDPSNFVSDLQLVIDHEDSVGKFINLSIRGEALKATIA
jgi:hypothetical protein